MLQKCSLCQDLERFDSACELVLDLLTQVPMQGAAVLTAMKYLGDHASNFRGIPSSLPTKSKNLATNALQGAIDFFAG
eukprot:9697221-Heterocapsa_arctica.AAC.1